MSALDLILSRVEKAREVAPGRWRARCPAHDGRNANTLSLTSGDDGRALVHCFHGCKVGQVVAALGLDLADLMPPRPTEPGGGHSRIRAPFVPAQVFDVVRCEAQVLAVIACDVDAAAEAGAKIDGDCRERLHVCMQRLDDAARGAYGRR